MEKDEKNLDFEEAKDLTIQDAIKKHKEIEAGVTPEDNILDKYIKQHPEQVAAQKFSAKNADYKDIDTSSLDSFIKRQREELEGKDQPESPVVQSQAPVTATSSAGQGVLETPASSVASTEAASSETASQESSQSELEDVEATKIQPIAPVPITPVQSPTPVVEEDANVEKVEVKVPSLDDKSQAQEPVAQASQSATEPAPTNESEPAHVGRLDLTDDDDDFFFEEDRKSSRKKRVIVATSAVAALLALLGLGYGVNNWNKTSNSTVSSQSSQSSQDSDKKAYQDFQKSYQAFFVDANQTKLKNDQFDKVDDLEDEVEGLKDTDYYDDAQADLKSLKKQINAIKTINGLFDKAVIEDGKLVEGVKVKSDANFDNLSDDVLNTGNDTLDRLIEKAIRAGKKQLTKTSTSSSEAPATQTSEAPVASAPASEAPSSSAAPAPDTNAGSNPGASQAAPAPTGPVYGGNIRQAGITNYTPSILQRNLSVVPYNASVVQNNVNSDAWIFAPGILEGIIATAQSRGYFAGNDFILEPININSKGQGFYNVYRTDGTYLFTINCKTGAWAGNAAGHSGPETLGWS